MKGKIRSASPTAPPATRSVRFQITAPRANKVFIAGSFNDWRANDLLMIRLVGGDWAKDLTLSPSRYEYLLVVDDSWVPDPAATETVPNPFFGVNAIAIVPEASA
jgi:1,4-alpha-glucan branching enzyme